jgi:hypothetical protein
MKKFITYILLMAFSVTGTIGQCPACAAIGDVYASALPAPGQMVALSPSFSPVVLKGIQLDAQNPFRFHFFVDSGDSKLSQEELKTESSRLIKYFLASLTIPEKDLWVNLSPYEKDRIVPQEFGQTEMGRDLLAQDYLLKQITASLIYPESQLGKEFWAKVYAQAQAKYGTTNIPINTFNKVWILPDKAVVYENGGTAYVLENHLKVMLEEDYLSLQKHQTPTWGHVPLTEGKGYVSPSALPSDAAMNLKATQGINPSTNELGSQVVREIVIPALTKEVNEGKNFAQLRQVFYSLILATWYKNKVKDSILNRIYSNQNKIMGVNVSEGDKAQIYQKYLRAFKKGVFNYIKDTDTPDGVSVPRRYFSGGVSGQQISGITEKEHLLTPAQLSIIMRAKGVYRFDLDLAMTTPSKKAIMQTVGVLTYVMAIAALVFSKGKILEKFHGTNKPVEHTSVVPMPVNNTSLGSINSDLHLMSTELFRTNINFATDPYASPDKLEELVKGITNNITEVAASYSIFGNSSGDRLNMDYMLLNLLVQHPYLSLESKTNIFNLFKDIKKNGPIPDIGLVPEEEDFMNRFGFGDVRAYLAWSAACSFLNNYDPTNSNDPAGWSYGPFNTRYYVNTDIAGATSGELDLMGKKPDFGGSDWMLHPRTLFDLVNLSSDNPFSLDDRVKELMIDGRFESRIRPKPGEYERALFEIRKNFARTKLPRNLLDELSTNQDIRISSEVSKNPHAPLDIQVQNLIDHYSSIKDGMALEPDLNKIFPGVDTNGLLDTFIDPGNLFRPSSDNSTNIWEKVPENPTKVRLKKDSEKPFLYYLMAEPISKDNFGGPLTGNDLGKYLPELIARGVVSTNNLPDGQVLFKPVNQTDLEQRTTKIIEIAGIDDAPAILEKLTPRIDDIDHILDHLAGIQDLQNMDHFFPSWSFPKSVFAKFIEDSLDKGPTGQKLTPETMKMLIDNEKLLRQLTSNSKFPEPTGDINKDLQDLIRIINGGQVPANNSTVLTSDPGGIDLNPAQLNMQIKNGGEDFKFDSNGITIDAAQVTGATFTILDLKPISNLSSALGLNVTTPA